MKLKIVWRWNKIELGENIEIDKNTAEWGEITKVTTEPVAETIKPVAKNKEGEITEEITESVAETIEPVAENNFLVTVAPYLTIREGRNRHPPVWLVDYNSAKGLSEEDEENMTFFMISDSVNFEKAVKSPRGRLFYGWRNQIHWKKNQTWNLVVLSVEAKKIGVK